MRSSPRTSPSGCRKYCLCSPPHRQRDTSSPSRERSSPTADSSASSIASVQLFRRERQLVHLHRLEVLSGMLLLLLQQLDDALLAEAVGVLDAQEMRVVIVRDLVVRAGDPVRL